MSNHIALPPFVKKFRQTVLDGGGQLDAVTEYQRRVTLMIHPQDSTVTVYFNDTDTEGILLQPYTLLSIEGYNGVVGFDSAGKVVIYEGLC